jgi:hypothetical protein
MNAFKFRGARLLDWRKRQADQAREAFVRAAESARETADLLASAEAGSTRAEREHLATIAAPAEIATLERHRN